MKDDNGIGSTSAAIQDSPHLCLIHQQERSQSTKLRLDLTQSDIR